MVGIVFYFSKNSKALKLQNDKYKVRLGLKTKDKNNYKAQPKYCNSIIIIIKQEYIIFSLTEIVF